LLRLLTGGYGTKPKSIRRSTVSCFPQCLPPGRGDLPAPRYLSGKDSATNSLNDFAGEPSLDKPAEHLALNALRRNLSDSSPSSRQEEQRAAGSPRRFGMPSNETRRFKNRRNYSRL